MGAYQNGLMHSPTCSAAARWFLLRLPLLLAGYELIGAPREAVPDRSFYLPADTKYTLVQVVNCRFLEVQLACGDWPHHRKDRPPE